MLFNDNFLNMDTQYKQAFEPYTKLNSLVAKNLSELTQLQIDSAQNYSAIIFPQIFANNEVKDIQGLMANASRQYESMTKFSQQMMNDSKKVMALAHEFKSEFDKIITESIAKKN